MQIEIDAHSGFCFGVDYAIQLAEENLRQGDELYCLGSIVHNDEERKRLEKQGLKTINKQQFVKLKNKKVLLRAHGEAPETYRIAAKNGLELVDATCPIVLRLQTKVQEASVAALQNDGQIVIFGKSNHAEVIGLKGHAAKNALVISSENDLTKIDYTHPISIFSQTTQGLQAYFSIIEKIKENVQQANGKIEFVSVTDSICRQVSNREEELRKFAIKHDIILFVAGKDSSNGKQLFAVCKRANSRAFFMSNISELPIKKIVNAHSIGICGATSTPRWQMTDVLNYLIKKKI